MSMARYSAIAAESAARACSLWLYLGIQRTEAAVAVGLKGAHTEFLGQSDGLVVVGFGLLSIRRITTCGGLAEGHKACAW